MSIILAGLAKTKKSFFLSFSLCYTYSANRFFHRSSAVAFLKNSNLTENETTAGVCARGGKSSRRVCASGREREESSLSGSETQKYAKSFELGSETFSFQSCTTQTASSNIMLHLSHWFSSPLSACCGVRGSTPTYARRNIKFWSSSRANFLEKLIRGKCGIFNELDHNVKVPDRFLWIFWGNGKGRAFLLII